MAKQKQIDRDKIDVDKAFAVHVRITDREVARRALLVDNIKDLVWMFETQSYKAILGFDPPPQWTGYLGMVEIYYSRAEVERWRKIWLRLVVDLGLDLVPIISVPTTRLEDIARVATGTQHTLDLIAQAKELGSLEWRNVIAELQGKPTSYDCKHNMKLEQICKSCGVHHEVVIDQTQLQKLLPHESGDKKV